MKKIEFTQEQINEILTMYNNNYTQKAISEKFGVSRPVIKRILNSQNIIIRKTTQKYKGNYGIFEDIDTPEKAYWLGFIAADGCNYWREKNASIIINIHQKDLNHLIKFKKFCQSDAEIKTFEQDWGFSNKTPMCKIVLNSKKMSEDLTDKGIIPNKSLVLKPPKIKKEFYLPYILGYFDGDGSISKTSQYNNYSLSIQGTKETLEWINGILNISTHLEKRTDNNNNNYYIRCGGTNKPYQILKKLYDSCEVHLDRKYEIYKTLETVVFNGNIENY